MALSNKLRFRVFARDNFTCQYCGLKGPATQLNVDHRIPQSKGGTDDMGNLVTACVRCNNGKSADMIPIELKYDGGPLDGQLIRTTEFMPLVWIWKDVDGKLVELLDAIADREAGDARKVKIGPSWVDRAIWHPDTISHEIVTRLRFRESDGATSELLGAYVAGDVYPFHVYPLCVWMEPWQLLLDFDFNDYTKK